MFFILENYSNEVSLNLKNLMVSDSNLPITQKIEHFISLFTIMCIALVWLTIIGADYSKNKHHYHLKIRDTRLSCLVYRKT